MIVFWLHETEGFSGEKLETFHDNGQVRCKETEIILGHQNYPIIKVGNGKYFITACFVQQLETENICWLDWTLTKNLSKQFGWKLNNEHTRELNLQNMKVTEKVRVRVTNRKIRATWKPNNKN